MIDILTKTIRTYFAGKNSKYVFRATQEPLFCEISKTNLYIHIPFCKNSCPYCPYNKVEYNSELARQYLDALITEIDLYHHFLDGANVGSIYIGGGTPTLLIDELGIILKHINNRFKIGGDVCIETSPNDITEEIINKLKEYHVDLVSVGVQSFQNKYLKLIGRNYCAPILDDRIGRLTKAGFKSINLDLMFALPDQLTKEVVYDLQKAIDLGVDQITTYPLFTFPYTTIGKYLELKKVKMPALRIRHEQYHCIYSYLLKKGFKRVSVWGFKKNNVPRYSSVTRDSYIGLGAGAGSHMSDGFYLNTFSVEEYIRKCLSKRFPTALKMVFNESMQNYFWLYWRLYDTYISKEELLKRFGKNDGKIDQLFWLFKQLRFIGEDNGLLKLTERGAFWIHLLQNYFSLRYINKVWSVTMKKAYPEEIIL